MLCYSTWEEWELIQATSRKEKLVLSLSEATTESGTAETGSSVPAGWVFQLLFPCLLISSLLSNCRSTPSSAGQISEKTEGVSSANVQVAVPI